MNRFTRILAATAGVVLAAGILSAASTGGTPGGIVRVQGIPSGVPVPVSSTPPTGASSTQVQGTAAAGAAAVGNPVQIGGSNSGTMRALDVDSSGRVVTLPNSATGQTLGDAFSNSVTLPGGESGTVQSQRTLGFVFNGTSWDRARGDTNSTFVAVNDTPADAKSNGTGGSLGTVAGGKFLQIYPYVFNGTSWDRARSAAAGENVGGTGLPAIFGRYLGNATQLATTTGNYSSLQIDPAGNLRTAPQRPTATDILDGSASVTATTGSTALITVSAGRTWVGDMCISVSGSKAAAATGNGEVIGTFLTAGTGVTPAAGQTFEVDAGIGANAATGATGTQGNNAECMRNKHVVAPAGNTVTLNYTATCTNTSACRVSVSANGVMQ